MKMDKATIEIILFDNADILTASGGGGQPKPDSDNRIWLTKESVLNYNAYSSTDVNLKHYGDYYSYYAYNGGVDPPWAPEVFILSDYSNTSPGDDYLYNVTSATDREGYYRVYNWLQANIKT